MSSTQYLSDVATRHQVFLERYSNGRSKEAMAMLSRLRRDINARLSNQPTEFQTQRLAALLAEIDVLAQSAFTDIGSKVRNDMFDLVKSEAEFSTKLYSKATTVDWQLPASTVLTASVMSSQMTINKGASITIDDALKNFGSKKKAQILQTITDGVTLGDTTPTIARKVGNIIETLQRRQLDALVRTITNNISSEARNQVYEANSDIMDGYVWISTLDSRTTLICGARDQKVYTTPNSPRPPAHWNCRSTTIPKIKEEYDIGSKLQGQRPAVGSKGAEQVSSRTSYGGWLKKQPVEFVDEALGVERSKLFRSGKLTIDKFTDPTGRIYTLDELGRMNGIAMIE